MGSLRIIAGQAKGRRLRSVPGDSTRPITDRVKESLFNILGADVEDSAWLDLFAGTGSVGIEALSRGASFVRFIDIDRVAVQTVKSNLAASGLEGGEVVRSDAFAILGHPPDRAYDYVYIAPPQYKALWKKALLAVDGQPGWLAEDAWVIAQIHPKEYEAVALARLEEFDQRRYGSTILVFYQRS